MERTVDILIEISIYSAVITAFILLFRAAFKKRISPKVQYAMWLLLVLRLMLPVTIESGFHVESLLPQRPAPVVQEESIFEAETPVISEVPVVNIAPGEIQPSFDIQSEESAPAVSQEIPENIVVSIPEVKEPAFNIRWRIAAFWTWVAGAMAFGLWMMIVKLRFYEDMQRHTASVSPRVYAIYDECCAALGVKPITMWAVDRAISPGIAFFTYPVLLLPASMDGDEEKLRYAFLHELTHKKRHDHHMTALLTALRIIYWFNPAVHIGFSEMRADMETACDAEVIAFVGKEQKRGYLTSILELFSYATRPQLGMSQASSRRMAKRRMKGAFMRERTTFLGRAAALMLAVIMLVGCFTTACQSAPAEVEEAPELEVVNAQTEPLIDVDGDGLEDVISVSTDNTADENFAPETAKATLTVKLGKGETITQDIPGWWQNAEYHTADLDSDNRTDIALMLWAGGSNYDATNVYVYHMGNSKLTELAKNVITNESITYDQSKYSALNGENTHWVSGGTVISEGGKSKLRLRQLLDYDPGAGIATAYYTNLVWNGSGWFIESMEIGEAYGEEQVYPDTLQYAPVPPDPINTLSDMDLLIYSSLTNNSKVYALPRTLSGNDLSTSIWDNILLTVNDRYFDGKPYDAAGAAYNVVQVCYNDDGTIDVYLILTYRQYDILNDELSVTGELNCAVIWQYKENESGEIEFSNVYWPIKDSNGRVSYGNRDWPEDLQKYTDFSPDSIGRAERLKAIDEQIAISMDNNEKVDALLSTIVSSPKGSSAPIDYIHEHVGEYGQLCAMGRRAVSHFMPRFEAGRETGLEGQIMAAVLNALTGVDSVYNYENGQEYYDANREEILAYLQTSVQPTPALNASSPEWQTAERVCAPFSETGKRIDLSYYEVSIDLNGTERISAMTENNVTPDQFDRTDDGQTLLLIYRASADAINDSSRMEDLFLQFARISRFETVTEFIQLDHTAYFGADSPVYRMDKMTSVMDIAEPGWEDIAYTTYFVYLTPQWDYRGQTQSQNIVLGFRFINAIRGDIGGWKLLQTEADCEKWMDTVRFGDAFADVPNQTSHSAMFSRAIVDRAERLVGKKYERGSYGPETFDGAGLVYYVLFNEGVEVTKQSCREYSTVDSWKKIEDKADLQPGDILFFYGDDFAEINHTGIYIGNSKMIDASSSHGKVIERSCEIDYWQEHFAFARRVA